MVTGPNTVVEAVAAGKKAAKVIDHYLRGEELIEPLRVKLPKVFVEPATIGDEEREEATRAEPATLSAKSRKKNFEEVELPLSVEQATREAQRCLRCDLEFTQYKEDEGVKCTAVEEKSA